MIFLPVDPTEDFGVVGIGGAESDAIGPILGKAVFFGYGLHTRGRNGHLHRDVGLLRTRMVLP